MPDAARTGTGARLLFAVALLCCAVLSNPRPAAAQTRADSAAVLLDAARRFELDRRGEVAAALYQLILAQYGDTPAAARIRTEFEGDVRLMDRSGRTELLVWGTTYGLWLGVALPLMADAEGPEPYGLGLLAGGPLGFLAAHVYTRNRPITSGQARALTWGSTWGTWQGFGWVEALDIGDDTRTECPIDGGPCFDVEEDNGEELVAGMVVGGLAGIATGALLARRPISAGTAATVSLASLWGAGYGAALGYLAGVENDALLVTALLAGNGALAGSALGQRTWQLSESRARLISIAGLAGALAGAGIDLLMQPDDDKVAVFIPTATATAGLVFGIARTRGMDRSGGVDGGPGDLGALMQVRNGTFVFGAPQVRPRTLVRGNDRTLGVYLPVFAARF